MNLISDERRRRRRNSENTKRFEIARNIMDDFIDEQKIPMQDDSGSDDEGGLTPRRNLPFYLR